MQLGRILSVLTAAATIGVIFLVLLPLLSVWLGTQMGLPALPHSRVAGGVLFAAGMALVLYCAYLLVREGKGTPAPMDPPRQLVPERIYTYSRNPMYVGYALLVLAEVVFFGRPGLLIYALLLFFLMHVYVVFFEEPGLEKRFGKRYREYRKRVPRWVWRF